MTKVTLAFDDSERPATHKVKLIIKQVFVIQPQRYLIMMTQEEIRKHLEVLKIQDAIANVSLKDVNSAFRKLASEMHPDKAGDASTAAFQELLNSCHILRKYLKEKTQEEEQVLENDDDFKFFEDNFEKFNFPFVIEDYLADTWQECMENILGVPKVIINAWGSECDRIWKVKHGNS